MWQYGPKPVHTLEGSYGVCYRVCFVADCLRMGVDVKCTYCGQLPAKYEVNAVMVNGVLHPQGNRCKQCVIHNIDAELDMEFTTLFITRFYRQ